MEDQEDQPTRQREDVEDSNQTIVSVCEGPVLSGF